MHDETRSCQQTLQINLFFDGTNNNDAADNPRRDSLKRTHTNVARLFNVAIHDPDNGISRFYIPGVGTPLPEIGEETYLQMGKAMAKGFNARCLLGYVRLLNAAYYAIASDKGLPLISRDKVGALCAAADNGNMSAFQESLNTLGVTHKLAVDNDHPPRTIKKIWINVIGFSRGAACARAFVHKLVNEWAPGGNLTPKFGGLHALQYQVNFVGLFDTVASVGPPDSTRATVNIGSFDGHFAFANDGAMRIPDSVRYCVHAFSIHEQRMSFPVDSIREVGGLYPSGIRYEIAYPGVHSDVGGGYGPNEQGKGRDPNQGDGGKLSLPDLATHLRAFLFAGIGDGMTAMVRFFDPRNTGAVLELWGEEIRHLFLAPIAQLSYRGRHDAWQTVQNRDADSSEPGRISRSVVIELAQGDIDRFMAHSEPDELMASLIDLGHIDHTLPYRSRFVDFEPRYGSACEWGFTEPRDRLAYCDYSYRYGADFDRHPKVREALMQRLQTGGSFDAAVDRIPGSVWNELKQARAA